MNEWVREGGERGRGGSEGVSERGGEGGRERERGEREGGGERGEERGRGGSGEWSEGGSERGGEGERERGREGERNSEGRRECAIVRKRKEVGIYSPLVRPCQKTPPESPHPLER